MSIEYNSMFLGLVTAIIAAGIGALAAWWNEQKRKAKAPTLENKINTLTVSLKSFASVISEIETEIDKRRDIAERLRGDVQRYEQLKELTQSQVEAITQTITGEVAGESKKSIWRNAIMTFVIASLFFLLGFWIRGA